MLAVIRSRVFENRLFGRIFGPKRDEVTGKRRRLTKRSFMICTPQQILFGDQIKKNVMGGICSTGHRLILEFKCSN